MAALTCSPSARGVTGYSAHGDSGWPTENWQPTTNMPTVKLTDPHVRLVDTTGNGAADILDLKPGQQRLHTNLINRWVSQDLVGTPQNPLPEANLGDPSCTMLADVAGEGLLDVVRIGANGVEYWPQLGGGKFGHRRTFDNVPQIEGNFEPADWISGPR